jgi:hypothetical protein
MAQVKVKAYSATDTTAKTANILAAVADANKHKSHTQVAVATADPAGQFKTYQPSPATSNLFPTIVIPGYSGPL